MTIPGRPPSLINRPSGCHFHPRCPYALARHREIDPALRTVKGQPGHSAACLLESDVRRALWRALRGGAKPQEARRSVGLRDDAPAVEEAAQ